MTPSLTAQDKACPRNCFMPLKRQHTRNTAYLRRFQAFGLSVGLAP
jgi:hypothetical protein